MKLSTKVALVLSLAVALVGGVGAAVATQRQAGQLRAQFRETNLQALEILGLALAPSVADGKHHRAQAVLDNVANFPERYPDVRDLEVVDPSGRVVADMDPRRFGEMAAPVPTLGADPLVIEHGLGELEVIMPIRLAHTVGTLRARLSDARLEADVAHQERIAVLLVVAGMTVLGVALYLLHRRLLGAPLVKLASVAAELRGGRMNAHAPIDRDDEIGQLGRAFNEMAAHLEEYTSGLESAVSARTADLEAANHKLEELATKDALTGLCNRRHFEASGARILAEGLRRGTPVALVLSDIDHFKAFNDRRGHPYGDEVLRHFSSVIGAEARAMDVFARIGGEEFAVIMPNAGAEEARGAAERMRQRLEEAPVEGTGDVVTASFGVASTTDAGADLGKLLKAADDALYAAKRSGRNRVSLAPRPEDDPS